MIGIYLPFMTNYSNVDGCSVHNNNKVMIRRWVEQNEHLSFIFPVYEGLDYDMSFLDHPRIITMPMPVEVFKDQYRWSTYIPQSQVFEKFLGEDEDGMFFDFILNPKTRSANYLEMLFNNPNGEDMPIFNFGYFVTSTEDAYYRNINPIFDRAMYFGMTSGYTAFESDASYRKIAREGRRFLSLTQLRRIDDRRLPNVGGIPLARVLEHSAKSKREKGPLTFQYSGRLSASMSVSDVFDTFDSLYSFGRDIKMVVTSQGQPGQYGRNRLAEMKGRGIDVELHAPCSQEKFWEIAGRCHIKIASAKHGEFFNATAEQAVAGVVPIIRKADFSKELWDGYPFVYSNSSELQQVVRFVVENYWDAPVQEPFEKLRQKIIERFDIADRGAEFTAACEAIVEDNRAGVAHHGSNSSLVASAIKALNSDEFTFSDIREKVKEVSDTGVDIGKWSLIGKATRLSFHRVIQHLGFEGVYDQDLQLTYRKAREVDLDLYIPSSEEEE